MRNLSCICLGGGVNGFVFVLWVFVIKNLNKGNINMERNVLFMMCIGILHCSVK